MYNPPELPWPWSGENAQMMPPSRGLGDTVAKVVYKISKGKIKPCGGCKKRQGALNRWFTYKYHSKVRRFFRWLLRRG